MMFHLNLDKNYTLEIQQNYDGIVISPNLAPTQTCTSLSERLKN